MRPKVQIRAPDAPGAAPLDVRQCAKAVHLEWRDRRDHVEAWMGGNDMWEEQFFVIACFVSLFLKNESTPRTQDLCLSHL
jgi:hypothetical protein